MATRRTTMRSRTGTKLYAVRDESGQFKDIQTYERAHGADPCLLHTPSHALNDALIPIGANVWVRLVEKWLGPPR